MARDPEGEDGDPRFSGSLVNGALTDRLYGAAAGGQQVTAAQIRDRSSWSSARCDFTASISPGWVAA